MIYLIRPVGSTTVHIGVSSSPTQRMNSLQEAHPVTLELLAVLPGGEAEQNRLSKALKDRKLRDGWFDFDELDPVVEVERLLIEGTPATPRRIMKTSRVPGLTYLDASDSTPLATDYSNSFVMGPNDFRLPRPDERMDEEEEDYDCRFSSGGQ